MNLLYVPCKNEEEAKQIGKMLVEAKFAHCTNIIPAITSYYFWEGSLQEDSESVLLVKTTKPYEVVKEQIEKIHSYDCPAILLLNIEEVNECYAKWARDSYK